MSRQRWGSGTLVCGGFGVVAGLVAACAGSDIPPVDDDLRGSFVTAYGAIDGLGGAAGASMTGSAGRAMTGRGGGSGSGGAPPSGSGGSAVDPGPVTAGSGGGGAPANEAECDAMTTVFATSCNKTLCHNAGSPVGDFAVSEAAALAFVDKVSDSGEACGLWIDSRNIEESLILTKVNNTFATGCGQQMPLTGALLEDDEIECIAGWLNQFAR